MRRIALIALVIAATIIAAGCVDNTALRPLPDAAPAVVPRGETALTVVLPPDEDQSPGLTAAAEDLAAAVVEITASDAPEIVDSLDDAHTGTLVRVRLRPDHEEPGEQGYSVRKRRFANESIGLQIDAMTATGAMYGLYDIIAAMGVRYHHPEETFFPTDEKLALPWHYDGTLETPHFELRGFHEHTQHPIPMSDFYLRPNGDFRGYVSRYLRWLARNRQNVASWHMLKTVDLETWEPYAEDIIEEAHGYGINIGMVLSYVDEQQNNFKIIEADRTDGDGNPLPDDEQITEDLQRFTDLGFDFFTFQIGSSEFTKPDDQRVLSWLDTSSDVATNLESSPMLFTWIHTTCSLKADDGDYFYHLPAEADPYVGAWVHTVMFHTLEHPAPVYDCEDFTHQKDYLVDEEGERDIVYFPETAWWLGFDNNMPLALPLTGWTRAYDIQESLAGHDVRGHITFTSGREWSYWQYDHYLTRATWDASIGWEDYLEWIEPMYADGSDEEEAAEMIDVLSESTDLQRQHFFEDDPLIYFYLAGELRQDEIGEQAGILARRPKLAYRTVVEFDDAEFEGWRENDWEMLVEMSDAYHNLLSPLSPPAVEEGDLSSVLAYELYTGLKIYVERIEHALALYGGVQEVRKWVKARENGATEDDAVFEESKSAAEAKLEEARAITEDVEKLIASVEPHYRYPAEILIEPKPETLTSYPFGYLEQTHTAHFWSRRDEQLATLIEQTFSAEPEVWSKDPGFLFFAEGNGIELLEPDHPVAAGVITGFVPRMLHGLRGRIEEGSDTSELAVAQDYNENFLPDGDSEESLPIDTTVTPWRATADSYTFIVHNSAGETVGDGLTIEDAKFDLVVSGTVASPVLETGEISGEVASDNLVDLVVEVGGIDRDGAEGLLKTIFDIPDEDPLPEKLPFRFGLTFEKAP